MTSSDNNLLLYCDHDPSSGPLGVWDPVSVRYSIITHAWCLTAYLPQWGLELVGKPPFFSFLMMLSLHNNQHDTPSFSKSFLNFFVSLGKWERIMVKDHHRPHSIRENRIEPWRSWSANNAKLGNRFAKLETRKSSRYLRDTISTLKWHTMT